MLPSFATYEELIELAQLFGRSGYLDLKIALFLVFHIYSLVKTQLVLQSYCTNNFFVNLFYSFKKTDSL